MKVAALTSSLPDELPEAIAQLAQLGFEQIDVPPTGAKGEARRQLEQRHLKVGCVALEGNRPAGIDLASDDESARSKSIAYFRRAIEATGQLGAPVAYLTPPLASDDATQRRWTSALVDLGDHAARHRVRVCIEHFPRRLLPTVQRTLEFLDQTGHTHLALLIDVGHCLISGEDPAAAVRVAGKQLGYVHFDDNDGQEDRHWALLTGKLTERQIRETIQALQAIRYTGALCLELNRKLEDPVGNLRRGKAILERYVKSC